MPRYVRSQLWWSEPVQEYTLSTDGIPGGQGFTVDWLESVASFSFRSRAGGRYTLRKQIVQRGSTYWYAYRRLHGHLVKRYVGKTTELSIARLEEVAHFFADEPSSPASPSLPRPSKMPLSQFPEAWLLFSKLSPPRLPALLVRREALLARLDTSLFYSLTLLQAPAGFGKTTLVAQWIAERRSHVHFQHVIWLSLDAGDNDPLLFWRSLIKAFQVGEITVGQTALAFLSRAGEPPFQVPPLETILASFLHDLACQLPDGLLILDDYHLIMESCIHESVTFFLNHLPPKLRVLLLSRVEPPLPLLHWRAKGMLFELHRADLRFSLEETSIFLHLARLPPLPEAILLQLDAEFEGWAAGLRLLAHTLQEKRTSLEFAPTLLSLLNTTKSVYAGASSSQPYQQILDYFVIEILQAQSEAFQQFLLQTSVLDHLSASLCNVILGDVNGAAQLEAAERAGLFLEAVDCERFCLPKTYSVWYRYHPLWSLALRREARMRLGEERLQALLLRASHWYEQQDMLKEAIETALQAQSLEWVALLIERMDTQGQISEPYTLHRWLSLMPEDIFRTHPMLCWLYALSLQLLQSNSSASTVPHAHIEMLLSMAKEEWQDRGALTFLGLINAFHALSDWQRGAFSGAIEYSRQALAQFADDRQYRRIRMFRGICLFIIGTVQMYAGRFDEARSPLLEASSCGLIDCSRHFTRSALLLLGICSDLLGEMYQAQEYYQLAISDASIQEDREIIAQAKLGLARIALERNNLLVAEHLLQEATLLTQKEDVDLQHQLAFQLACLCYARGQIASAEQQFAALQVHLQVAVTSQAAQLLPIVYLWQARCALQADDLRKAQRLLGMLIPQEQMIARILLVRLTLAQHQPHSACQQLVSLLSLAQDWRQTLEIQILLALAYAACQDHRQAQKHLRQALSQACSEGLLCPFLLEGEPIVHLLRQLLPLLREPVLHSYVLTILYAFQSPDKRESVDSSSSEHLLLELLSPQEQRVLKLLVAGHSNQGIAQELVVSINTVKDHVKHLYQKLGVNTRLQASQVACRLHLM